MSRRLVCVGMVGVLAVLSACSGGEASSEDPSQPQVEDAYLGETEQGRAAALYLTITQEGGDDRLVGVTTEVSDIVGVMPGDMAMDDPMTDRSVDVAVDAGTTVRFAPGDDHLMVIEVSRGLVAGDDVEVTLEFERHGTVTVQAETLSLLDINERAADQREADESEGDG